MPEAEHLFTGLSLAQCYALAGEKWGVTIPDGFHDRLMQDTFATLRRELVAMPGAAEALARVDLPKCIASSADCIVVEDSVPGITGALAAGMTVYGYRAAPMPGVIPLPDWNVFPDLLRTTERA